MTILSDFKLLLNFNSYHVVFPINELLCLSTAKEGIAALSQLSFGVTTSGLALDENRKILHL